MKYNYRIRRINQEGKYQTLQLSMTKEESISCLRNLYNLINNQEKANLLRIILPLLDKNTREIVLNCCFQDFPDITRLVLDSNGINENEIK